MKNRTPGVTIGVTSCNRMHYTRALLQSLQCVRDGSLPCQLIVVDTGSVESGLQDFLTSSKGTLLDDVICRVPGGRDWINDEYIAKNIIIDAARHDTILFAQDDCQFIGDSEMLRTAVAGLQRLQTPCVDVMGVRRSVLSQRIDGVYGTIDGVRYWNVKDNHFPTTGLFKTSVFDTYGPYPTTWDVLPKNWGRSEDEYDRRLKKFMPNTPMSVRFHIPLFISIWNDPRGGYAFIRGDKRWGHYLPPVESGLYYNMLTSNEYYRALLDRDSPASFDDVARPIGWSYPKNKDGEHVKYGQNNIITEGPSEDL